MQPTILVGVDLSDASHAVVPAAASLAMDVGARLLVVHVRDGHGRPEPALQAQLEDVVAPVRRAKLDVHLAILEGKPADALLAQAAASRPAMVVVGTSGAGGARKWLLGSVAQEVLRRSGVPVLVVPARMMRAEAPAGPRKQVLAAADFTSESDAAYEAALRLAKDIGAGVRLLHVVEIPFLTAAVPYTGAIVGPEALADDEEAALGALGRMASAARAHGVAVTPAVQVGHVPSAVLAEARSSGAAVIVVGTHGKDRLRRFLLGSVAQAVVEMADRPVLVVPLPDGERGGWVR